MKSVNDYVKILMIVNIVLIFPLAHAQRNAREPEPDILTQATLDARIDADYSTSSTLWLGAGCLFSIFAVGAAYLITPSPRTTTLIGKSPEYIVIYTEVYKSTAHDKQLKYAAIGCGISGILYAVGIIVNNYIER